MVEELAEELAAEEPTHLGLHSKLGQRLADVFASRQVEHELAAEGPRGQSLLGLVGAEGLVARRVKWKHVCGPAPTKEQGHPRPGVSPLLGAGERGRGALFLRTGSRARAAAAGGACSLGNTWTQRVSNSRPFVRFPSFLPVASYFSLTWHEFCVNDARFHRQFSGNDEVPDLLRVRDVAEEPRL